MFPLKHWRVSVVLNAHSVLSTAVVIKTLNVTLQSPEKSPEWFENSQTKERKLMPCTAALQDCQNSKCAGPNGHAPCVVGVQLCLINKQWGVNIQGILHEDSMSATCNWFDDAAASCGDVRKENLESCSCGWGACASTEARAHTHTPPHLCSCFWAHLSSAKMNPLNLFLYCANDGFHVSALQSMSVKAADVSVQ